MYLGKIRREKKRFFPSPFFFITPFYPLFPAVLTRIECNGLEFILSGETREKSKGKGRGEGRKNAREREREKERDEEESIREMGEKKESIARVQRVCLLRGGREATFRYYKHGRSIKMGSSLLLRVHHG